MSTLTHLHKALSGLNSTQEQGKDSLVNISASNVFVFNEFLDFVLILLTWEKIRSTSALECGN